MSATNIVMRAARADEAPALSALAFRSKAYWGYDAQFMNACREELTYSPASIGGRETRYVVAERAKNVVAERAKNVVAERAKNVVAERARKAVAERAKKAVAERAGSVIVGFYVLEIRSARSCELEALFVEPACIGKGIGRALIEHAKWQAGRLGAKSMTIQGDPNALAFYRRAGGVVVGTRASASIAGRDLPLIEIELHAPAARQ